MTWFELAALLVVIAALTSYLNHRFLGLPTTVGLMVITMGASLVLVAAGTLHPPLTASALTLLSGVDFNKTVMQGMLGFLLFAGALHIDLADLAQQKGIIALLATLGLIVSTAVVGLLTYAVAALLGFELRLLHCFLFGALISPTDPIAVLGILKSLGAPKSLETKIAGESLFNDGVGVVLFLALLEADHHFAAGGAAGLTAIAKLFVLETGGGVLFGLAAGYLAYSMLKSVDNYQVEVLISLALVAGGYALAVRLHLSGPIAMVVAGLLIGNHGRAFAMSEQTRGNLDTFWELIDEILNALLFALIGLEVLVVPLTPASVAAGLLAIVVVLAARTVGVTLPMSILGRSRAFTPHAGKAMIWGGLRGGISVALALSLASTLGEQHPQAYRLILAMTYFVVAFSIIVQGLTVGPLLRRLGLASADGRKA